MSNRVATLPVSLYESDETAWLEQTSSLIAQGRFSDIDPITLSEYLSDMAKRDKREVLSRLTTLLTHLLKWDHQPDHRTNSWRGAILEQRRELREDVESGSLRRHAEEVFAKAYVNAVEQAAAETGLAESAFPPGPPATLDEILMPGFGI